MGLVFQNVLALYLCSLYPEGDEQWQLEVRSEGKKLCGSELSCFRVSEATLRVEELG